MNLYQAYDIKDPANREVAEYIRQSNAVSYIDLVPVDNGIVTRSIIKDVEGTAETFRNGEVSLINTIEDEIIKKTSLCVGMIGFPDINRDSDASKRRKRESAFKQAAKDFAQSMFSDTPKLRNYSLSKLPYRYIDATNSGETITSIWIAKVGYDGVYSFYDPETSPISESSARDGHTYNENGDNCGVGEVFQVSAQMGLVSVHEYALWRIQIDEDTSTESLKKAIEEAISYISDFADTSDRSQIAIFCNTGTGFRVFDVSQNTNYENKMDVNPVAGFFAGVPIILDGNISYSETKVSV
jgi:hypothetical protein